MIRPQENDQGYKHEFAAHGYNARGTALQRTKYPLVFLDNLVFDERRRFVSVLEVGVGRGGFPLAMSYQPLQFAAHLQAAGADYHLTCVDIDDQLLERLGRQQRLYFFSALDGNRFERVEKRCWDEYVSTVGGRQWLTREPKLDLWFDDLIPRDKGDRGGVDWAPSTQREILTQGVRTAPLPVSFLRKRTRGQIKFVEGDIATVRLPDSYDFIHCGFVLYQLNERGQQMALGRMMRALRPGGILIFDDYDRSLSRSFWLDDLIAGSGCFELLPPQQTTHTTYYHVGKR